jgi:hypothetical protein
VLLGTGLHFFMHHAELNAEGQMDYKVYSTQADTRLDFQIPPGTVIDHIPASRVRYIGSPSITVLPNGEYIAAHDIFGPSSPGSKPDNELLIFGSLDNGLTWIKRAEIKGFWCNLFIHNEALYVIGVTEDYGYGMIRRSLDGGRNWTTPTCRTNGLLLKNAQYHTAPVPVVFHANRIWRAMEDGEGGKEWGKRFRSFIMSASVDADLLVAENWTLTNHISGDETWLEGNFGGWLEGNAVVTPDGQMINILRVAVMHAPEKAAVISISPDGHHAAFDPQTGFIDFPGGAKKFTIRFDAESGCYWSLVNYARPEFLALKPGEVRNTLALTRSTDLKNWEIRAILLEHPDPFHHAFQYVDWLIEGDDIIAVSRTAFDDAQGGAHNNHDANFLTFHRFHQFRKLENFPTWKQEFSI